jgi:hypothetical protein
MQKSDFRFFAEFPIAKGTLEGYQRDMPLLFTFSGQETGKFCTFYIFSKNFRQFFAFPVSWPLLAFYKILSRD